MSISPKSIRTFIGAKDFDVSREFYSRLGFEELQLSDKMSYFRLKGFGFYLQNYYSKDWVENTMIFLEVENLSNHLDHIQSLKLDVDFKGVRVSQIQYNDWGNEFFIHDPSGVLWHIGEFNS